MITITTMDGREVATLRDRDGTVSERQIADADRRSPAVPVGDTILALGRYLWSVNGVRVLPQYLRGDRYVLRAEAAVELGRLGGKVTGGSKAAAARVNGTRPVRDGNRPRGRPRKDGKK